MLAQINSSTTTTTMNPRSTPAHPGRYRENLRDAVLCLPLVDANLNKLDFRLALALLATRVKHSQGFIVPYVYPCLNNVPQVQDHLTDTVVMSYLKHEQTMAPDQTYIGLSRGLLYPEHDLSAVQGFARWQCEIIKDHKLNPIVRRGDDLYLWGARYWLDGVPYISPALKPEDKLPAITPNILRLYC